MPKSITNLSNKKFRNQKLSIKLNLLLILKLSNPLGITFILRSNWPRSYIIRPESYVLSCEI